MKMDNFKFRYQKLIEKKNIKTLLYLFKKNTSKIIQKN